MDAQEEVRVDQDPFERELNPVIKASAIAPAGSEEVKQRPYIGFGDGPAVSEAGNSGEDLGGAGPFFGVPGLTLGALTSKPGLADKDRATAGSVPGWSSGLIRTTDLDGA